MNVTNVDVLIVAMTLVTLWLCVKCIRESIQIKKLLKQCNDDGGKTPDGNVRKLFDAAMSIALGSYRRDVRITVLLGWALLVAYFVLALNKSLDDLCFYCMVLAAAVTMVSHKIGCSACIAYGNTKWKFVEQYAEEGKSLPPGI